MKKNSCLLILNVFVHGSWFSNQTFVVCCMINLQNNNACVRIEDVENGYNEMFYVLRLYSITKDWQLSRRSMDAQTFCWIGSQMMILSQPRALTHHASDCDYLVLFQHNHSFWPHWCWQFIQTVVSVFGQAWNHIAFQRFHHRFILCKT